MSISVQLLDIQIDGGFEEPACCLQEAVLIMASWEGECEGGGGWGVYQAGH